MPTTLYLRNLTAANPPTAGEKSTALPVDTLGANNATGTDETRALNTAKGSLETSLAKNSDAQTAARDNYLARFTSAALAAQTIATATWTIAIALNEANLNANSFLILSVYVWRPSTSAVVGFIYDSHTSLGVEWGATEDGQVVTFAGSAVTATDNDVIVLEIWRHAAQGMAAAYAQTIYFDGATDVTDTTTTDAASYLKNPNVLSFAVATVQKSSTDTGTGAETNLKQRQFTAAADAGAGSEVNLKQRQFTAAVDSGSGVEAQTRTRLLATQTDTGAGTETQLLTKTKAVSDTGSGVEAQSVSKTSVAVQKSSTDTGSGVDTESVNKRTPQQQDDRKTGGGWLLEYSLPMMQTVNLRGSYDATWHALLTVIHELSDRVRVYADISSMSAGAMSHLAAEHEEHRGLYHPSRFSATLIAAMDSLSPLRHQVSPLLIDSSACRSVLSIGLYHQNLIRAWDEILGVTV